MHLLWLYDKLIEDLRAKINIGKHSASIIICTKAYITGMENDNRIHWVDDELSDLLEENTISEIHYLQDILAYFNMDEADYTKQVPHSQIFQKR